ncbi:hypothetical protein C5Y97_25255 [Blastopirellula marina]|uniref:Uncharacterized protein n=2 Tax=Blastopirellula marina TaxID=124 RepID=A0A2S8F7R9_9BACT|nr:hypothetical protein C5Y98_25240 [Blastopirellula marina]PTL41747.1 hypothetical protein C5Y97_25255 [Blastopirellula marina]
MEKQQDFRELAKQRAAEARRLRVILGVVLALGAVPIVLLFAVVLVTVFGHSKSDLISAAAIELPTARDIEIAPLVSGKSIELDGRISDASEEPAGSSALRFTRQDAEILAETRREVLAIAREFNRLRTQGATDAEVSLLTARVERGERRLREWLEDINRKPGQPGYSLEARQKAAKQTLMQQGFSEIEAEQNVQAMVANDWLPDPPRVTTSVPPFDSRNGGRMDDRESASHASDALAEQYGESREWIEKHRGTSSDAQSVHFRLAKQKLLKDARKAVESGQMSRGQFEQWTGTKYDND